MIGGNTMAKRKLFGGYVVTFKGCTETMEQVFGSAPMPPSEMTKKMWEYVKSKNLAGKQ